MSGLVSQRRTTLALSAAVVALVLAVAGLFVLGNGDHRPDPETRPVESRAIGPQTEAPESGPTEAIEQQEKPVLRPSFLAPRDDDELPLQIEWRPRRATLKEEYPDSYAELRALAEAGDGEAARRLHRLLWECGSAPPPQSDEEIEATIAEARQTYILPTYRNGKRKPVDFNPIRDSFDANVDRYVQKAKKCREISMAQRAEAQQWLDQAVLRGEAGHSLDHVLASYHRDDALKMAQDVWNSGDPMALQYFSGQYGEDYRLGRDPEGLIKQYAYTLAFFELLARSDEITHPDEYANGSWTMLRNEFEEIFESRLHRHEVRQAKDLARDIIRDNPNCCIHFRRQGLRY